MKRDTSRLSSAAARVEADLRRTTDQSWVCSVAGDYTLRVSNGAFAEALLLDDEIEDTEWFTPQDASPAEIDGGLDADADELIAGEVVQALRTLGFNWPTCEEHDRVMDVCAGWWYCEGKPYHDVAPVGSLPGGADLRPALA